MRHRARCNPRHRSASTRELAKTHSLISPPLSHQAPQARDGDPMLSGRGTLVGSVGLRIQPVGHHAGNGRLLPAVVLVVIGPQPLGGETQVIGARCLHAFA